MCTNRFYSVLLVLVGAFLFLGIDGCSSNPNVEGAKLDLGNKDYDRALENVTRALEQDPQNSEALGLKGQILQQMSREVEDPEEHTALVLEMVDAYMQTMEMDSTQILDIHRRLRVAYLEEWKRGVEAYAGAQRADVPEQFLESAMYFQNASRMFTDSVSAYFNEAVAYLGAGMPQRAVGPLEMSLQLGDKRQRTYIHLAQVYNLLAEMEEDQSEKEKTYERMIRTLEPAAALYPEHEEIQNMLVNAYVLAGQHQKALQYYEQEVSRGNSSKLFLYNYGTLLLRLKEYDRAIDQLQAALAQDSLYVNARFNLGAAYQNKALELNADYRALQDRLRNASGSQVSRIERQMSSLGTEVQVLFGNAIVHLEAAWKLTEGDQDSTQDICRALYQAYGQTNQISKAEALTTCAAFDEL